MLCVPGQPMLERGSGDGDAQQFEAAQHIVENRLLLQDGEAPNTFRKRGEQRDHLHAGEVHTDARMWPSAKAQVIAGPSQYVEAIRVGVLALVSVCGAVE